MARAHVCGIKRGGAAEDAKQPPRKTTGTTTRPNPNKQEQMQNTQTAAEKQTALLAAREARLEAERQRAEEEKTRAAAEASEIAELERQEEEERKAKEEAEKRAQEEEAKRKAEEEAKKAEALRLVTAADEEDLVAALRRQGVEIESLGMGVAGTSREGAEKCWPCWKRDQVCEKREGKRQVTKKSSVNKTLRRK